MQGLTSCFMPSLKDTLGYILQLYLIFSEIHALPRFLKLCWYNKICILDLTYCNLILCFTHPRGKKEIVAIKPILYFFLYIFFSVSLQNTVNNYIHLNYLPKLVITTSLTNNKIDPSFLWICKCTYNFHRDYLVLFICIAWNIHLLLILKNKQSILTFNI